MRGYYQSEGVGDRGYAASLELAGPSLADYLPGFVGEFRPFAFVEGGRATIIHPLKDQDGYANLMGVGGGLRWRLFKHLKGGVTVGVPLISRTDTKAGDARVTFSAKGEF